ncbi:hypothetical protein FHR75_001281 [Kineococcus radiotolerans]|uniref:Uncharacterized protein n=1 Tax=Kineococcus radiotolerans TaxID=131568 RepID=A0A7W4TKV6_KINRA|nr:hypothetical protein [Kineococcus radiotolerans]MBB2900493.1 hypothetical protein [Kineococcus radiotolerans]
MNPTAWADQIGAAISEAETLTARTGQVLPGVRALVATKWSLQVLQDAMADQEPTWRCPEVSLMAPAPVVVSLTDAHVLACLDHLEQLPGMDDLTATCDRCGRHGVAEVPTLYVAGPVLMLALLCPPCASLDDGEANP